MTEKERIRQEVEKTLQCFDGIEKIEPRPFFFTRLKARINSTDAEKKRVKQSGWGFAALRPALLSLLIVLNFVSAIVIFRGNETRSDNRSEYLSAFAEEYSFTQETEDLFSFAN
ncbi:MAG: hypothetical protein GY801_33305 [bacterium]|nr:hypothetical protein [bacterium]